MNEDNKKLVDSILRNSQREEPVVQHVVQAPMWEKHQDVDPHEALALFMVLLGHVIHVDNLGTFLGNVLRIWLLAILKIWALITSDLLEVLEEGDDSQALDK